MRCLLLIVLSLIFFFACGKDRVEQIKVDIPEGIIVPDDMVYIPAGNFIMGHSDYPDTKKGKLINQEAFLIDRFEVTREQFSSLNQDYSFQPKKARFPVSMVTFDQAEGYCKWKGRRLPNETEWEKSARSSDGRKWAWKKYYEHPNNGFSGFIPEAVDRREEWVSPYGVYGMGYNVWEWMSDWYVSEKTSKADSKRYKVIRGGVTQTHTMIKFTPTFFRNKMEPKAYFNFIGFRCACSINCS